jgi:DNA repair protein RecN (Recombination protein N)
MLASAAAGREELARLGAPEEQERALDARRAEASASFLKRARALSRRRRAAAAELAARVQRELGHLAMEKTRFEVAFESLAGDDEDTTPWTARGLDAVEFLLSPNPGEELRPLARIASGGELSRILLALNAVAAVDASAETLVFDEVDAGIGGRVAEVVGRKLRTVAETHQVLCVTHLPQIASLADRHYVVSKREVKGRTVTDVRPLDGTERIEEVARMLGGATITDTTRRHAREMVKLGEK